METATNFHARWLFPGRRAAQPLDTMLQRLRDHGFPTQTARTSATRSPPRIRARGPVPAERPLTGPCGAGKGSGPVVGQCGVGVLGARTGGVGVDEGGGQAGHGVQEGVFGLDGDVVGGVEGE